MSSYTAIDLFSGAGGASVGISLAGIKVIAAVEMDQDCVNSYKMNFKDVEVIHSDIRYIKVAALRSRLNIDRGDLTILKACPPCQGFSTLSGGRVSKADKRNDLIFSVIKFVREFKPKFLMIENVPGFAKDQRFTSFTGMLLDLGYSGRSYVVNASDFGVPQSRKRLIYLASRMKNLALPTQLPETSTPYISVRDAFKKLATLQIAADDLGVHRPLTPLVAKRVACIPVGGNRHDMPLNLQLSCHRRLAALGSRSAAGPYGRLKWDKPAPTMTTRCTSVSCGSFIHPEENRGISLREAAILQTFPVEFRFSGKYESIERQIGNAVPADLVCSVVATLIAKIAPASVQVGPAR